MNQNPYIGRWWTTEPDGRVQCDVCPRHCQLKPNQRGFCFVRMGTEQGVELTTYGRSSGFCIDPIEKKPLNHFFPGTPVLSFGTAGCNLGCKFCQNWDISKARDFDKLSAEASPSDIARVAKSTGCTSAAFTYNDPVIFAEYAIDTALACRELEIHPVAVSAGYICPSPRRDFFAAMDAANIDLKAFTQEFYKKLSLADLSPVLDTLEYVAHETECWLEITTLVIPGANDSIKELTELTKWVYEHLGPNVPLHFSAFHPDFKMRDFPSTSAESLTLARRIGLDSGLNFVYTGNVHDVLGSSTYCPECAHLLIERDWYELGRFAIRDGLCSACGTPIPGHFQNQPGNWGAKRQPLDFSAIARPENI